MTKITESFIFGKIMSVTEFGPNGDWFADGGLGADLMSLSPETLYEWQIGGLITSVRRLLDAEAASGRVYDNDEARTLNLTGVYSIDYFPPGTGADGSVQPERVMFVDFTNIATIDALSSRVQCDRAMVGMAVQTDIKVPEISIPFGDIAGLFPVVRLGWRSFTADNSGSWAQHQGLLYEKRRKWGEQRKPSDIYWHVEFAGLAGRLSQDEIISWQRSVDDYRSPQG
ncbi:MAG TPA: hypothetical protein VF809_01385 [Candidatus Saccharimonadales bacterium]